MMIYFLFYLYKLYKKEGPEYIIEKIAVIFNKIYAYNSLVGNKPYYTDTILKESHILTQNFSIFREEVLKTYKSYKTIKGDLFFNDIVNNKNDWKKLYIKWHSDIDPYAKKICPKTCKIIESLPNVKVAMFSVLSPGAKIPMHRGPYKGFLRYHLGILTPNSPDCFINVNDIKYSWKDGEGIVFDDTFIHWVENNTDKTRIILFCDIIRPMNFIGKNINTFIIKYICPYTTRSN